MVLAKSREDNERLPIIRRADVQLPCRSLPAGVFRGYDAA